MAKPCCISFGKAALSGLSLVDARKDLIRYQWSIASTCIEKSDVCSLKHLCTAHRLILISLWHSQSTSNYTLEANATSKLVFNVEPLLWHTHSLLKSPTYCLLYLFWGKQKWASCSMLFVCMAMYVVYLHSNIIKW